MKTHIFHVISKFDLGGAERVALNIAKSGNKSICYHLVEVIRTESAFREQYIQEAKAAGVLLHQGCGHNSKLSLLFFPFRMLFLCLQYKPKIIHSHTEVPDTGLFLYLFFFGWTSTSSVIIRTLHSVRLWTQWERFGRRIESFYKRRAHLVAISTSVKSCYEKAFGCQDIVLIYNGIEQVEQIEYREKKEGVLNILFAGRLSEEKGVRELEQIIKHYANDNKIHFHVIGSGPLEHNFKKNLDGVTNISYKEKIYNISRYLGSFDYMIMPSHFEGLGLMAIEASYAKLPCIINDCPGLKETLPANWPLKVVNNSVQDYIRLIGNLLIYSDRERLCGEAFSYVQRMFSLEKMQCEYESLYRRYLQL